MKKYELSLSLRDMAKEREKLGKDWRIILNSKLRRIYQFDRFMDSVEFVTKIASTAETLNHHPDIYIFFNQVKIEVSTHKIGGLTKLDFILAKRIENDFQKQTRGGGETGT